MEAAGLIAGKTSAGSAKATCASSTRGQAPSHEKLYLLERDNAWRVVVGSANLSLSALTGRMRETFVVFDGPEAHAAFAVYAAREEQMADPVKPDLLIATAETDPDDLAARAGAATDTPVEVASLPVPMDRVPAVRSLEAGLVAIEQPRKIIVATPSAEALRKAGRIGVELREMTFDRDRKGASVITAQSFLRAWQTLVSKPVVREGARIHAAAIDLGSGLITLGRSMTAGA